MAENKTYPIGTIKLTYINPEDQSILHGQMFKNLDKALEETKKNKIGDNWLIFELISSNGQKFDWKLLPYGKHKSYEKSMKLTDNIILRNILIAVFLYGAYTLIKTLLIKIKN